MLGAISPIEGSAPITIGQLAQEGNHEIRDLLITGSWLGVRSSPSLNIYE